HRHCSAKSRPVHLWHSRYSLFRVLTRDGWLLFLTRYTRLFAYGALSVVLVFYLTSLGLSTSQTGVLLTLTLVGDTVVSLYLTTHADRIGRRRMLIVGAMLMAAAGLAFASTRNFAFLVVAGTIGVISPSGNEVGPFLSIEQAALSQVVPGQSRTAVFAWYTLVGSFATAAGALGGGTLSHLLQKTAITPVESYRVVVLPYNILLILVPLMPSLLLAILVLLARFSISQMDVPTRQSYIMAVVGPEERSAAGGVTGVARTIGAALAPVFAGFLYARPSLMS